MPLDYFQSFFRWLAGPREAALQKDIFLHSGREVLKGDAKTLKGAWIFKGRERGVERQGKMLKEDLTVPWRGININKQRENFEGRRGGKRQRKCAKGWQRDGKCCMELLKGDCDALKDDGETLKSDREFSEGDREALNSEREALKRDGETLNGDKEALKSRQRTSGRR